MSDYTDPNGAALELVKAIRAKTAATAVEVGYRPLPDGSEPKNGERHTWYATATLRSGRQLTREADGILPGKTMVDALTALARALGLRIRMRYRFDGLP